MSLQISARQRDMLAAMGLPMHGWLALREVAVPSLTPGAAPAALLVNTMDPAVRGMPLGAIKREAVAGRDAAADLPLKLDENGVAASQAAIKVDASVGRSADASAPARSPASPQARSFAPTLWSWAGQRAEQAGASAILLLLEGEGGSASQVDAPSFPLQGESQELLGNILQALAWPQQQIFIASVSPDLLADPSLAQAWQAQIQAWQPGAVLLLGRKACQQVLVLPVDVQTGGLSALREQAFMVAQRPARVSYPLGYLLRNPQAKAKAWQDWLGLTWAIEPTAAI